MFSKNTSDNEAIYFPIVIEFRLKQHNSVHSNMQRVNPTSSAQHECPVPMSEKNVRAFQRICTTNSSYTIALLASTIIIINNITRTDKTIT